MYIKAVKIQGFLTYKEETIIEFSPHHTVVVGKNGSGKSNIFAAIQFVLSDRYSTLRAEDRQKLLHQGAGREIMLASVEIIFDNSQNRFPADREEVSIKRTIGLKKDEYFLNNTHKSKTDIVNFLESAGISRSNPYNIVPQGKVKQLVAMKPPELLDTFKEIAGTRVYDDRRKESLKIMTDTDLRRDQIQDVIDFIETRLGALEKEKSELKQYQTLDSTRRCLEYTLYDKELKQARSGLDENERARSEFSQQTEDSFAQAEKVEAERLEVEEKMKTLTDTCAKNTAMKARLDKQYRRELKQKARAELAVRDLREQMQADQSSAEANRDELKLLETKIAGLERERQTLQKSYEEKVDVEQQLRDRLAFCDQRSCFSSQSSLRNLDMFAG
jgi:structural maintenance of chromosome 3 (chondroitin sulfate proteoglycan 6)